MALPWAVPPDQGPVGESLCWELHPGILLVGPELGMPLAPAGLGGLEG